MLEGNITFEKIVEKTKRMLGKNYRGDKEMIPVHSELSPIEGHTDAFSVVSNGGFSNDEVNLIKDKTKNYAWWVANKGYLVDDTQKEIPALFIYGSEIGSITPNVLNFNGLTSNNFYLPINRTDMTGVVNNSANHIYVQFLLDGEVKEYETDRNGNNNGLIEIDETTYNFYAGRLYPEDRKIIDSNIVYPIYLISNLDYYYIPTIDNSSGTPEAEFEFLDEEIPEEPNVPEIPEGTPEDLGGAHDAEPMEQNNLEILQDVCEMVIHEAAQWTNRLVNERLLMDCWPVIVKCSCIAYLNRGAEGLGSQSELGQQNVYNDWVALMHKQITNRRYVL